VPDSSFSVTGSGPVRTLTITPAPNQSGSATITLTATPSGGQASSDTFTLTIGPVNDAPTFTKGADQTTPEDSGPQSVAGWATNLGAGPNESGQALSFQITGNTNPGLFSAAPAVSPAGTLSYTPAPDASGVATVTLVLKDDGGTANGGQDTSAPQTFLIAVAPVNDAPTVTAPASQRVPENGSLFFGGGPGRITISDIDAQSGAVAVTLTASNGTVTLARTIGLSFSAGDGTNDAAMSFTGTIANVNFALDGLFFYPAQGFTGAASLTIAVDDQGNTGAGGAKSAAGTVNITVEEGGTLQFSDAHYSVSENSGRATITVTRAGGAAGSTSVRYTTTNGTATAGSDFFNTSGALSFAHGETSKAFTVTIINDSLDEADETINITLSTVTGSGALGSPATAVLTIINDDAPTVSFKDGSYVFNEGGARAVVTISRGGDRRLPASVKFQTVDDPAAVPCDPAAKRADGTEYPQGAAYARCDYATTVETLSFAANEAEKQIAIPLIDDAHPDGVETLQLRLSEPHGASLGPRPEAALTITDNDSAGQPNPVGMTPFFVRQQYLDFLSREPEAGEPWSGVLNGCPDVNNTDPASPSAGCDRILVSQSFFQSAEFQLKGFYSYLFYRVAFGRRPEYSEIIPDMRSLAGATGAEVFARRTVYATAITQRPEFAALYGQVTNQQYVEALLGRHSLQQITTEDPANFEGTAQVTLTRQQLIDALNNNTLTRAQALRAVVQSSEVDAAEYHGAFVSMQYYGYLRRTPEQSGYGAWLRVIKQDPNNIRVMVNGFVNSREYRLRFGRP
jgi:hypothetical protein